jgi:hypothetical protein
MRLAMDVHERERRTFSDSDATAMARATNIAEEGQHPMSIAGECVRRGVLVRERTGEMSFGHLTYQEYLVAEWMASSASEQKVWSVLLKPWWSKVLEFYASRKMDIRSLVEFGEQYTWDEATRVRMAHLVSLASLTPGDRWARRPVLEP